MKKLLGYEIVNGCYEATDNTKAVWYQLYGAIRGSRRMDKYGEVCRFELMGDNCYWERMLRRSNVSLPRMAAEAWSIIQYHMNFGC